MNVCACFFFCVCVCVCVCVLGGVCECARVFRKIDCFQNPILTLFNGRTLNRLGTGGIKAVHGS